VFDNPEPVQAILKNKVSYVWHEYITNLGRQEYLLLLLFRILNRGLFALCVNCVHNLAVITQTLREFFLLDYFAATWKRIPIFFPFKKIRPMKPLI